MNSVIHDPSDTYLMLNKGIRHGRNAFELLLFVLFVRKTCWNYGSQSQSFGNLDKLNMRVDARRPSIFLGRWL